MKKFLMKLIKWQTVRYLIAGGSAFVTNITILFILVQFFYVWYLFAAIMSFVVAVYVSFIMQKFFTFNDYGKQKIKKQQVIYFSVQVFNLCLSTLLMYIGVDLVNIHYIVSQILISGTIAIYSFFLYKHLVFNFTIVGYQSKL